MTKYLKFFKDITCWITGGGSGICKALAIKLSEHGANVIISGRSKSKLEEVKQLCPDILPLELDVTSKDSWYTASQLIEEKGYHPQIVFYNAGTCKYIDLPDFPPETFKEVMDVNFMGIINGIHTTIPQMLKKNDGHLVAVTSSVARLPLPRAEAYGASKAAATYLMDSLRIALSETNIKLTTVMPGFVSTPMTDVNDFPMPFIISPEDAADRILKGVYQGKKDIFFPSRFTWPLRFLASLPTYLCYQFTKRLKKT
ncbi:MAG: SDR family NAD(P)-dependent oxidoreductase [Lentisphaerales bacterium]|nr:SDR family NAD(P)-dependent oxidoreductase [Lentisphaerales bacterium]